MTQEDIRIIATALQYRIDNLTRCAESYRRHNCSAAQWDCIRERNKVRAALDRFLAQYHDMNFCLITL